MSALFCLFLCFRSYSKKLVVYNPIFFKIRYILEELYLAVLWILSRLIIYIDQLNTGLVDQIKEISCLSVCVSDMLSCSNFLLLDFSQSCKDSYQYTGNLFMNGSFCATWFRIFFGTFFGSWDNAIVWYVLKPLSCGQWRRRKISTIERYQLWLCLPWNKESLS